MKLAVVALMLAVCAVAGAVGQPALALRRDDSGSIEGGGPEWDSVALRVAPPGGEVWAIDSLGFSPPVVVEGRSVFAATDAALYEIDIDTGDTTLLAPRLFPGLGTCYWIDQVATTESLYVAEGLAAGCTRELQGAQLRVFPRGEPDRAITIPLATAGDVTDCSIAVREALFTACVFGGAGGGAALVAQRRALDGSLEKEWRPATEPRTAGTRLAGSSNVPELVVGISVVEDQVIPVTSSLGATGRYYWDGWVLNASTLEPYDPLEPTAAGVMANWFGWGPNLLFFPEAPTPHRPAPVAGDASLQVRRTPSALITGFEGVSVAKLLAGGEPLREIELKGRDTGARAAVAPSGVFVATQEALHARDRQGEPLWEADLPPDLWPAPHPILADDEQVFVLLTSQPLEIGVQVQAVRNSLVAYDARNGEPRWSRPVAAYATPIAAAGGVLVYGETAEFTAAGSIVVIGQTNASIALVAGASKEYPRPGEIVRVDLSGSRAGSQGAATQYRADWGDGEETQWQASPILEHGYGEVGDHVAHVFAANEAGQVSSQAVEFHVGRAPPQNFLQEQFSSERQNTTFFLLGLLATAGAGAIGLWRTQRKRGLLARELTVLEERARAAGSDPIALDRALDDRRLNARGLLLGGKLDEGQHAVIVARIEELSRQRRIEIVDSALDFLPHRHVKALREMLTDGRVSAIERSHYLALLDEDATVPAEYKARVRSIIEQWAAHDAGARSP